MTIPLLAITDMPLEETEILLIVALCLVMLLSARVISHLRGEMNIQRDKLREQAELNAKLEQTMERVLRIDAEGGIDGTRNKK
jgi:hypothetical protein